MVSNYLLTMAREKTVTDEAVLKAAREVFLTDGIAASTTEIAQRAGVSEALLFKRFHTKEELFARAMGLSEVPRWVEQIDSLVGQGEPKAGLIALGLMILESLRRTLPRTMMMWSSRVKPPSRREQQQSPRVRDVRALGHYMEQEMRLGRIRKGNPEVFARALLGPLLNYAFSETVGAHVGKRIDPEHYVHTLIDLLWSGMGPGKLGNASKASKVKKTVRK